MNSTANGKKTSAMPAAVVHSLVQGAIERIDAAPEKACFTMRQARRALRTLRAATDTRLGSPLLAAAQRLIAVTDRTIEYGTQTRVYTSSERLAVKASFFLKAPRAKTRACMLALRRGVTGVRSSIVRLPSELKTSVQVYAMAKKEQLATFSHESRLRFKATFDRFNLLLEDKVRSSKYLSLLSAKVKSFLMIAGILPKEKNAAEKPGLVAVEDAKPAQRAAPPRTFTSISAVTPTTMMHAVAGDIASISPVMLDSLRRATTSSMNVPISNPSSTAASADFSNPTVTRDDENVAPAREESFNAEGRGGLWVPSPAKVHMYLPGCC